MATWNGRIPTVESLARIQPSGHGAGTGKAKARVLRRGLENAALDDMKPKDMLRLADQFLDTNGVEDLYPDFPNITYCNTGDTYGTTLIYDSRAGRLYVGDWGSYVESRT